MNTEATGRIPLPGYHQKPCGDFSSLATQAVSLQEVQKVVDGWTLDEVIGTYVTIHRRERDRHRIDSNPNKRAISEVCREILERNNYEV